MCPSAPEPSGDRGRPGPASLAVRQSLSRFLRDAGDGAERGSGSGLGLGVGDAVVCGVSGGGDSLALAAACVHAGFQVTTVTVDHGLQGDSARVAAEAAAQCQAMGAESTVVRVHIEGTGEGPARAARYRALGEIAAGRPVLVAHTADDDAEGLLVSLARGSGTGSLAGLREISHEHPVVTAGASLLGRPLLAVTREQTRGSCAELGLSIWDDPHNEWPDFLRSRVRHELLPVMREILGHGVDAALTRSARLLREDADALDGHAARVLASSGVGLGEALPVEILAEQPGPVRRRVLRIWLGGVAGPLTSRHLNMLEALVVRWHGQGPVAVPWPVITLEPPYGATSEPSHRTPRPQFPQRDTHRLVVRRTEGALEAIPLRR